MQIYAYTEELVSRLNAYAWSIVPSPKVNYNLLHTEVPVPQGYLPIKIAQYYRVDHRSERPPQFHWAIFVPTSPVRGQGNYYEVAGDTYSYYVKSTINGYNERRGFERGSHTVGFVKPVGLPHLEAQLALTPVDNSVGSWNSKEWVCDALQKLNNPYFFSVRMSSDVVTKQMAIALLAWEAVDAN